MSAYERDKQGNVTGVAYGTAKPDPQNPSVDIIDAGNPAVTKEYDTWGRLTDMTDKLGKAHYKYDDAGALTETVYSGGMRIGYEYDIFGDVLAITYPGGKQVRSERDELGRVTKLAEDAGKETLFTYDENSNTTGIERPDGSVTRNSFDALDRMTSTETVDKDGKLISRREYTYDAMDRIATEKVTDKQGETLRTYAYNKRGELAKYTQTGAVQETIEYEYDVFGNKAKEVRIDVKGKYTVYTYEYDSHDRLINEFVGGVQSISYAYDDDGNLKEKLEARKRTAYTYDEENRLATTSVNGQLMSSITYDGNGLKAFELLRKEQPTGGGGALLLEKIQENLRQKTVWEQTRRKIKQAQAEAEFAEDDCVLIDDTLLEDEGAVAVEMPQKGSDAYWETIVKESPMDEVQMREAMRMTHIPAGALASYAPPMGQVLLEFAGQLWEDIVSAVDSALEYIYNEGTSPQGQEDGETPYGWYDEEIEPSFPIDMDIADQVLSVKALRARYLTEPEYEKILQILPGGGSGGNGVYYEPTRYVFDLTKQNPQVLAEFGNSDQMRTGYTYAGDMRVAAVGYKDTGYYVYDVRGSVSELLKGADSTSYRYDPYGAMTQGEPKQDRLFGYNGEEYTPQIGLQYLRARHYSPSDGRFTTQDAHLGNLIETISQNRYAYCQNDPVTYTDPSGYSSMPYSSSSGGSSGGYSNPNGHTSGTGGPGVMPYPPMGGGSGGSGLGGFLGGLLQFYEDIYRDVNTKAKPELAQWLSKEIASLKQAISVVNNPMFDLWAAAANKTPMPLNKESNMRYDKWQLMR